MQAVKTLPAVELKENIPAKHKFALEDLNEGDARYYVWGVGW